jgi:hypothetical protein
VSEHIDDALNTVNGLKEKLYNLEPLTGKPDIFKAQGEELKVGNASTYINSP